MNESDLSDEASCTRLCNDFMHYIDQCQYDRVVELFTPDGRFDRKGTVYVGRDAIRELFAARPPEVVIRHLCTNIRITLRSRNEAGGLCYALFFKGTATSDAQLPVVPSAPSVTEYHDEYVRTDAGWRIRERRTRPIFAA